MVKQILIVLLLSSFSDTYAQWVSDVYENTPVCTASYKQKEIRMDSDSDGGAFIVWRDFRTGSVFEEPDIYIQKIDSNGYAEWTVNGSGICILPYNQGTPSLTTDGKGGVIVAWTDRRNNIADIYAQRLDADGNILWALNGVPVVQKINSEHSPNVISDDNSGIIVVWEDQRWDADSTYNIWAQRIDSSGNPVWSEGGISICPQDSNRINHKVQRDGFGGAVITWQDGRKGPGDYDIWAQRVNSDGEYLWQTNGIPVCVAPENQINPKIDPDKSTKGVFICWMDKRNGIDYDIYANRIDSNGVALWGESGKPVVTEVNSQSAIDILSNNKTNGLIVTWKDKRTTEYDIYVQKLDLDGNPVWQTNGLKVCGAIGDQLNPNIVSDKNGGAIIVWQDKRGFDWDIYAQRVSYNGNMIWTADGEPVCLATNDQTSPRNVPDNKGGTIITWEDKRGDVSKDIYMHHLLIEDTVTYPQDSLVNTVQFVQNLEVEYFPNPVENSLTIRGQQVSKYKYELLSMLGKKIEIIYNFKNDNEVIFDFNNSNISKGIYFIKLSDEASFKVISIVKN